MFKKFLYKVAIVAVILLGSLGFAKEVSAAIPYASPWGALYRNPEWSNAYGRSWFEACNYKTYSYICLEPYINYGCGTSITYKYKSGKKDKSQNTIKSGTCILEKSAKSTNLSSITFAGNGYGISFRINR